MRRRARYALCIMGMVLALWVPGAPLAQASATWAVQPTPNQSVASGTIQGISCVTSRFCTAVGNYDDAAGISGPLAQIWNGHSWHLMNAVNPNATSSSQTADFTAVSCLSGSFCMAIGSTDIYGLVGVSGFAELWNGVTWRLTAFAIPPGATGWNVLAVSCVTPTFCEAVGDYSTPALSEYSLAERWNGSTWSAQATPNQPGQNTDTWLTSVSCVTVRFCEATDSAGPLIEGWNGTKWTARTIPQTDGFTAVSCVSAKFCKALGQSNLSLIGETWNGTAWLRTVIKASAAERQLSSISCRSTTFCEAAGYDQASGTAHNYVAEWNGKSWRTGDIAGPAVTYQGDILNAVSCASAHYCVAAGASSYPVRTFLFNGASWSSAPVLILNAATSNYLYSVACVSATFCEAVGELDGNPGGLPEEWDGSAWKIQANASLYASFDSVSCVSASFCEAVGDQAARWNGATWTYQSMPTTF
jgi:hypothetical protein